MTHTDSGRRRQAWPAAASQPTSQHGLVHDAGSGQQQHVRLQHQVVAAICRVAREMQRGDGGEVRKHQPSSTPPQRGCVPASTDARVVVPPLPSGGHNEAASPTPEPRTIDTTSPGSSASPGSLPHLPLRYTLSGCRCGTTGMGGSRAEPTTSQPVGCTPPSAAPAWPNDQLPLCPPACTGIRARPPLAAHLLGRLQAPHVLEVLQALPHHRALEADQHDQGEEGVVPAGKGQGSWSVRGGPSPPWPLASHHPSQAPAPFWHQRRSSSSTGSNRQQQASYKQTPGHSHQYSSKAQRPTQNTCRGGKR